MTKTKKFSAVSIVLLIIAVIMLLIGGVGGARAALTESDTHNATLEMKDISVVLQENGTDVEEEGGELLTSLLGKDETFKVGKKYDEVLTVKNDGNIDEYVRVILYKYWTDGEGKAVDLDPGLIKLGLGSGWKVDESASTIERTVLYYTKPLEKGQTTEAALESITIDSKLATMVTMGEPKTSEGGVTTVEYTYKYNGLKFGLKAEVDGVQTHNAEDAIKSAWGKEMSEVIG